MASPSARAAARPLAIHSVDEFVLRVPDLAVARHFYTAFGLDVRDENGALALYTHGHPHRWARVLPGSESKQLAWLSCGIHAGDLPAFAARLDALHVKRIAPPPGAETGANADGLWLEGPDGLAIQLRVAEKCSPSEPAPREFPPPSANQGRAPERRALAQVRPLHLSHILLFSADVPQAAAFYQQALGLRVSDHSGGIISFMHSPHGSDHHLVALAASNGGGLHHSSWCVPSLDAVGVGSDQMARAGYGAGWGVGRHVLGSNYFRYVRDPWGSYAEYSFDIDFVAPDVEWPSADHAAEDAMYVWGPQPPDDFITNYEATARTA